MSDTVWSLILYIGGSIFLLSIIIYMFKKQRGHKDFLVSIIILIVFFIVCAYGSVLAVQQAFDNKNRSVASGKCTILILEYIGGRFGSYSLIDVEVNDVSLSTNLENFPTIKEGTYRCKVAYSKHTDKIFDLEILED